MVDSIIDDILGDTMLSGIGVGDEYDHLRNPPSKEEAKGIKKVLETPQAQKEIEKIDAQVKMIPAPGGEEYGIVTRRFLKNLDLEAVGMSFIFSCCASCFYRIARWDAFGPGESSQAGWRIIITQQWNRLQ